MAYEASPEQMGGDRTVPGHMQGHLRGQGREARSPHPPRTPSPRPCAGCPLQVQALLPGLAPRPLLRLAIETVPEPGAEDEFSSKWPVATLEPAWRKQRAFPAPPRPQPFLKEMLCSLSPPLPPTEPRSPGGVPAVPLTHGFVRKPH